MIKKILMFLSVAVFAVGLAGCEKADMDKAKESAGETMDKAKDAMGGGAEPAPAAPAPAEPAPAGQ